FGLVTAGIIMIFDFVLIITKKAKVKGLLEFILPAAYGVWWLIKNLTAYLQTYSGGSMKYGQSITVKKVLEFILTLCGGNNWQFILFILGLVFIVCCLFSKVKQSKFDFKHDYILLVFIATPALLFLINIIVSKGSTSVFVNRYFISIIVFFILIIGIAINMIIDILPIYVGEEKETSNGSHLVFKYEEVVSLTLTFAFAISSCVIAWQNQQADTRDNYKDTAENLMSQNDIYCDSTICIVYGTNDVDNGFEYYLTKNGKRDSINHHVYGFDYTEYDTIYVVYHHYKNVGESEYINAGYEKVSENTSLKIVKFVKTS
ncbi:MAG: hypothetical protein HDT47_01805, partial [Ruminococcaceae bacterium]|nr:hypothetical protein [Oscillospiraceae bacterium]